MGQIICEDATNIHFPQTCDVLVDDVGQKVVIETSLGATSVDYCNDKLFEFIEVWK